jgi:hypothetical protein
MHWSTEEPKSILTIILVMYTAESLYEEFKNAYIHNKHIKIKVQSASKNKRGQHLNKVHDTVNYSIDSTLLMNISTIESFLITEKPNFHRLIKLPFDELDMAPLKVYQLIYIVTSE